jgi:signal transduction histidine kinase
VVTSLLKLDSSCRSAIHMTRQILDFARHGQFRRMPIDLNTMIVTMRDFLGMLLPGRIRLEILPAPSAVRVMGDPDLLKHVLLNLVTNAKEAIVGEGWIRISADLSDIREGAGQDGPVVRLVVEDSGEGIEPEHLACIFEPDFTTRADGTGLGLFAVRNIVESHGGQVLAKSTPLTGTRFVILLPAVLSGCDQGMF